MSQLQDNLNEILRQKNTYLTPSNLKKDVTVLGVTGTYEGSGEDLNETITEQEEIIADLKALVNSKASGGSTIIPDGLRFAYSTVQNIPDYDMSKITNASRLFYDCKNLISAPNFDTSNVIDMNSMLTYCINITSIPNYNTINVTDMSSMLMGCNNLQNISNINTSRVVNMSRMFSGCYNLTTLPEIDTSNVTNMCQMFYGCENLDAESYSKLANILPLAENLSNLYISNIGLNINKFSANEINILANKGYIDCMTPKTYYDLYWD